jgi:aconitate hydratase
MGVLPLEFAGGEGAGSLGLTGHEIFDLDGVGAGLTPRSVITVRVRRGDGAVRAFQARVRVDTPEELTAYRHGGILPYVLRRLAAR